MADPTPDHEHGTSRGFNQHAADKTEPCDPCRVAWNQYQVASRIRREITATLRISVAALRKLLNGADPVAVLTQERGAEVVAAIRNSGATQVEVDHG